MLKNLNKKLESTQKKKKEESKRLNPNFILN